MQLIEKIRQSVIGEGQTITTPFGERPLIYADYTASGRALTLVEDYIRDSVLPFYANTHSESAYTGRHTTALREQARASIKRSVNGAEHHQVIFAGSGATAAIHKLMGILGLPSGSLERAKRDDAVVFIGPYEHHSNELPWRESGAELVVIPLNNCGELDLEILAEQLQRYQHKSLKIGSFSAASNVTGIKTDIGAVSKLLKAFGFISCWDFAAAAPYVGIDMQRDAMDAIYISPHKFIGGPGTPGVLVVDQRLAENDIPVVPGGGTVDFVTPKQHRYTVNTVRREEGGTPAIVESIRAGLVFDLQQQVGTEQIEALEHGYIQRALKRWRELDNIDILGDNGAERLAICSLQIRCRDRYLHYGFVVALLNDLFGIQARGGCSCAGPYGHYLLEMSDDYSSELDSSLQQHGNLLRPGWVRLNFNYFLEPHRVDYLIEAIALIAEHGWRLLPHYHYCDKTGIWRHVEAVDTTPVNLTDWLDGGDKETSRLDSPELLTQWLQLAEQAMREAADVVASAVPVAAEQQALRWFIQADEL